MHLLGKSIRIHPLRPRHPARADVCSTSRCGTSTTRAPPTLSHPVAVKTGENIRVTCTHDASLHQKLPALRALPPRYVTWGDGSTDEMCLGILLTQRLSRPGQVGRVTTLTLNQSAGGERPIAPGYFSASPRNVRATSAAVGAVEGDEHERPQGVVIGPGTGRLAVRGRPASIFPPSGPGSTLLGADTLAPVMNDPIVESGDLSASRPDCTPRKTNSGADAPPGA